MTEANATTKIDEQSTKEEEQQKTPYVAPTSPTYPPYGIYIDPAQLAASGYDAYVYPVSPQFSIQYYSSGYTSYPGSPSLHPQSPPINPASTSPPFSPTFQYALSPPTYIHSAQPFPPLHISSPVLSGTTSPGSPPQHYLPGPYIIQTEKKRHDEYHSHNIYVRGLDSSITDESFLEMCQVYGKVTSSKAIIDQKTGECKGYGFVMFEKEQECEEAIEGLNKAGFQASYAKVGQESFSSRLRHLQDETSTNIYISNLPLDTTEQSLEELFQPYQTISNRILCDPRTGLSRGVGFARLTDREAATAIIEKFNGKSIEGCTAPLQVRFADSPAQKKLKSQTARKRTVRAQPVAAFAVRPMMPITPETMLGIAPASAYYTEPHYIHQQQFAAQEMPNKQQEEDALAEELENKINISDA